MSLLYKETCEPLDCYDIVRCLDYDAGISKEEYFEVKQLKTFVRVNRFTGTKTTEQEWRMAVYYTWHGGGETGPHRCTNRFKFDSVEDAETYIKRLRAKEIVNGTHREVIDSIGDQCDVAV